MSKSDQKKFIAEFNKAKGDWNNIRPARRSEPDDRHVYGAGCSWNGPISKVGSNGGLPACPHCRGVLFEQSMDDWNRGIAEYAESKADPAYPRFIAWLSTRGKCSPLRDGNDFGALRSEFNDLTPDHE